jgi:hypothetical protein
MESAQGHQRKGAMIDELFLEFGVWQVDGRDGKHSLLGLYGFTMSMRATVDKAVSLPGSARSAGS